MLTALGTSYPLPLSEYDYETMPTWPKRLTLPPYKSDFTWADFLHLQGRMKDFRPLQAWQLSEHLLGFEPRDTNYPVHGVKQFDFRPSRTTIIISGSTRPFTSSLSYTEVFASQEQIEYAMYKVEELFDRFVEDDC